MKKEKSVPEFVKIVGISCYVGAASLFALGAFTFNLFDSANLSMIGIKSGILIIAVGIALLGLSVFQYFLGKKMIEGKKWTRTFMLVLSILTIAGSIVSIFRGATASGTFLALLYGAMFWIFLKCEKVTKYFK